MVLRCNSLRPLIFVNAQFFSCGLLITPENNMGPQPLVKQCSGLFRAIFTQSHSDAWVYTLPIISPGETTLVKLHFVFTVCSRWSIATSGSYLQFSEMFQHTFTPPSPSPHRRLPNISLGEFTSYGSKFFLPPFMGYCDWSWKALSFQCCFFCCCLNLGVISLSLSLWLKSRVVHGFGAVKCGRQSR